VGHSGARTARVKTRDHEDQLQDLEAFSGSTALTIVFPVRQPLFRRGTEPAALCHRSSKTAEPPGGESSACLSCHCRGFWSRIKLRELWAAGPQRSPLDRSVRCSTLTTRADGPRPGWRQNPSCKRGDVLNLSAEQVTTSLVEPAGPVPWRSRSRSLQRRAAGMLQPSAPLQPPCSRDGCLPRSCRCGKGRSCGCPAREIKRWFWCSVFQSGLRGSPNTQSGRTCELS